MKWQRGRGSLPSEVHILSNLQNANALIKTGSCAFAGLIVVTDGTNNVTVNIYDNTEASGTKRFCPEDMLIRGGVETFTLSYDPPVKGATGIYVKISVANGGSCSYQVVYDG